MKESPSRFHVHIERRLSLVFCFVQLVWRGIFCWNHSHLHLVSDSHQLPSETFLFLVWSEPWVWEMTVESRQRNLRDKNFSWRKFSLSVTDIRHWVGHVIRKCCAEMTLKTVEHRAPVSLPTVFRREMFSHFFRLWGGLTWCWCENPQMVYTKVSVFFWESIRCQWNTVCLFSDFEKINFFGKLLHKSDLTNQKARSRAPQGWHADSAKRIQIVTNLYESGTLFSLYENDISKKCTCVSMVCVFALIKWHWKSSCSDLWRVLCWDV